jgi:hypothetical protein
MLVRIGGHSSLAKDLATPPNPIGAELWAIEQASGSDLAHSRQNRQRRLGCRFSSLARREARAEQPACNPTSVPPGAGRQVAFRLPCYAGRRQIPIFGEE